MAVCLDQIPELDILKRRIMFLIKKEKNNNFPV